MKKTISINIAGAIFYIEEDAYDKLKAYLLSVQKYFANYEGSKEIVEDIESRIAEKFADKLKNNGNQALTNEDVEGLITSMGTVADFEAMANESDLVPLQTQASQASNQDEKTTQNQAPRGMFRDTKRKLLGGVCAGLANHLAVDTLWVRLLTTVLFFGLAPLNGIGGGILVLYIALWVAFPGNNNLEEDPKIKKLYRDPDSKVLGGVIGGIAKYTGWDLGLLRLMWVLSIFVFGTGAVLYMIFWLITPMAKTLTDKMHMVGQPITLENIETNIKRNINASERTEQTFTKLLLFPFRAIAAVFAALMPLLRFGGTATRIFGGIMLVIIGFSMTLGLVVALLSGLGLMGVLPIVVGHFPVHFFTGDAPNIMFIFAFLAMVIPFALLGLLGVWVITKRNPLSNTVWQSMLGVWVAGMLGASITVAKFASNFAKRSSIEKTEILNSVKPLLFDVTKRIDDDFDDDVYQNTEITLKGYDGTEIKILEEFNARGKSREEAEKTASKMGYKFEQKDSVVVFARNFDLPKDAKFREQQLRINVFVPYEKPFGMTESFARYINNVFDSEFFNDDLMVGSLWKFTKEGDLICLNRTLKVQNNEETYQQNFDDNEDDDGEKMGQGAFKQEFSEKYFENIDLGGSAYAEIKQGPEFRIIIDGDQNDVEDMRVRKKGQTLIIEPKNTILNWQDRGRVNIRIEMPDLKNIAVSGAVRGIMKGFDKNHDYDIETSGASRLTVSSLMANKITADITGASKLTLIGTAIELKADLGGSANLAAFGLSADNANVDASGAASVETKTLKSLKAVSSGASKIRYKGSNNIKIETSGAGSVEQEE